MELLSRALRLGRNLGICGLDLIFRSQPLYPLLMGEEILSLWPASSGRERKEQPVLTNGDVRVIFNKNLSGLKGQALGRAP